MHLFPKDEDKNKLSIKQLILILGLAAERAIRPFTIGRKNWVNIDTVKGAEASAVIYSIAETAKANNLRTYEYFELLLTELSQNKGDITPMLLDRLMPWSSFVQEKCHSLKKV